MEKNALGLIETCRQRERERESGLAGGGAGLAKAGRKILGSRKSLVVTCVSLVFLAMEFDEIVLLLGLSPWAAFLQDLHRPAPLCHVPRLLPFQSGSPPPSSNQ